ncbi:MAG: hypothetical protein A2270_10720 [Elusimicrobia bacterium RIFOXYA12_FULL_51_18]|nr:MAG: hypothetical protein A2270_10720 [Elusimicrobia bacterium RIFOXYA12_FULL_51_18]OGS29462.1 MAG: hypothetical protein A2218_00470 [Elusimicrobia bacterium RIFOXYA2_FULL_53_38]
MDILVKLRLIFWTLVIGLWGLFLYQYISKDLALVPQMRLSKNPFSGRPAEERIMKKMIAPTPYAWPRPPGQSSGSAVSTGNRPVRQNYHMVPPVAGGLNIKGILSAGSETMPDHPALEKTATADGGGTREETVPQAPPGFAMMESRHFIIYEEGASVSKELVDNVENLHGNIMLDLVAFSPWTRDNRRVYVFFAQNQDTYQRLTDRPAWSGGVASLSERKIYLFKSEEAFGILAHELTHIYFDSFFPAERSSPLWLSEGMATYIQSERGHSTPIWLAQNLKLLEKGGGFKLNDLVRIDNMQGADEDNVRLWYAQSYSIVRFLTRMKAGEAFYTFCKRLRDGTPVHQALYQAYGMPYNKLSSLEYAWRYDLKTGKISGSTH